MEPDQKHQYKHDAHSYPDFSPCLIYEQADTVAQNRQRCRKASDFIEQVIIRSFYYTRA
ncbi:hypothetical protein MKZ27_19530 [Bacillus sp. FSL R5-0394]